MVLFLPPFRVVLTFHQRDRRVGLLARHRPAHRVDRRHGEGVDGVGLKIVYGVARAARVGHRLLLQPLELGPVLDADRAPSEERQRKGGTMKKRDIGIVRFSLSNFFIYCPGNGLPGN